MKFLQCLALSGIVLGFIGIVKWHSQHAEWQRIYAEEFLAIGWACAYALLRMAESAMKSEPKD